MPLNLEFTPKKKDIKADSQEVKDFPSVILGMPYLINQGAEIVVNTDHDNNVTLFKLKIRGITVVDEESSNMLASVIFERLEEASDLFCLKTCGKCEQRLLGEGLFHHSRFKPIKSKNAKEVSRIKELNIPEEFCCPLSGDIIDHPVYDIRSPTVVYDYSFLKYWLDKSYPQLMPHTKLPFLKEFLKVNYELKLKIDNFVKSAIDSFEHDTLRKILSKCGLQYSEDKATLNLALLKLSESCNAITFSDDLSILFRFGVNVNAQDPTKKHTSLHLILRNKQFSVAALKLIYSGAKINIEDAQGITVFDIIKTFSNEEKKLVRICL